MFDSLRKKVESFIGVIRKTKEEESEKEVIELGKITKIKYTLSDKIKFSKEDIESIIENFRFELIQADVAYETSERIADMIKEELSGKEIQKNELNSFVRGIFRKVLLEILNSAKDLDFFDKVKNSEKPFKIIFFGINGSGKTTTIAKVAYLLLKKNFSVVFAAADTFRAGAIEQIEKHAQNLNVRVIKHKKGADSAAVIYDAIAHAKSKGIDVVLADTAGRMQTNINLMDEMKKICRVNKPDMKIFVGDALTGNDAISQAEMFEKEIGIDAVILTKMDADVKGGCALSIINTIKKPIIFIGVGQRYEDLVEFDKEWFVDKIVGK
ncbi:MAG: signal recognition particle-docking protein FtsY [Candidatus Altiarchaeota archaeon]